MVTRRRLRSVLTALGLYLAAALLIGYFGVNAFTGDHGLNARQNIDQQIAKLATKEDVQNAVDDLARITNDGFGELYRRLDLPSEAAAKIFRDNARRVIGLKAG